MDEAVTCFSLRHPAPKVADRQSPPGSGYCALAAAQWPAVARSRVFQQTAGNRGRSIETFLFAPAWRNIPSASPPGAVINGSADAPSEASGNEQA